jgi:hypothetical protein
MASAQLPEEETPAGFIRLHHGTDQTSAADLLRNGVDEQHAAAWNGSGEFWATSDHDRAEWFARSHPNSPPAACFEFDLPESALLAILQMSPIAVRRHGQDDYEFLPASHALLNQHMTNRQVVPVS